MQVILKPVGIFKKYLETGDEHWICDIRENLTVRDLIVGKGIDIEKEQLLIFVNGKQQKRSYILQDGDYIIIMDVIGGG